MKILLTGFEPFAGEPINPSWEAVKALADYRQSVVSLMLPCVFDKSLEILGDVARAIEPDIILAVGQAGGRSGISLEKVAINLNDARIADNAGNRPIDTPVIADAPNAYFSTLPIKRLTQALKARQIDAHVSYTAGTYVCNHVFFGARHLAESLSQKPLAGFVHIPFLPEQAQRHNDAPSMPLDTLVGINSAG